MSTLESFNNLNTKIELLFIKLIDPIYRRLIKID